MKTTREDWIDAGFALLREGRADDLTIERLCGAVQRTKGSRSARGRTAIPSLARHARRSTIVASPT